MEVIGAITDEVDVAVVQWYLTNQVLCNVEDPAVVREMRFVLPYTSEGCLLKLEKWSSHEIHNLEKEMGFLTPLGTRTGWVVSDGYSDSFTSSFTSPVYRLEDGSFVIWEM